MTLTADQIQFPPRTAQILRSTAGHEVVHGTTGSGKTTRVKKLLADDEANGRDVWVIDPTEASLPDWCDKANQFATDARSIEEILTDLVIAACFDTRSRRPLTVTIESATDVLRHDGWRQKVERALAGARGLDIRLRVVVNTLLLPSFGYSETIRSALTAGAEAVA